MIHARKVFLLFLFSVLVTNSSSAQILGPFNPQQDLVQFSGVVRNLRHTSLPHTTIINLTRKMGSTADQRGMFSFIVHPNDTIMFSRVGYN